MKKHASHAFLVIAAVAGGFAQAGIPMTPAAEPTPGQMVEAFHSIFGVQPLARANHANGLLLNATFTPSAAAATVTKAIHFQTTPTAVTLRFSNFGGNPHIADADPGAAPYGMSVKFAMPDGTETDIVMHSFNGFPARTPAEFRDFLLAIGKTRAGSDPGALATYLARHERARFFLNAPKPAPVSFASQPYFAVNTFKFVNAAGRVTFGRYRFVPTGAIAHLSAERSATMAKDYLRTEILQRVARAPVVMKLLLQLAEEGDALDDPTVAWPERRQLVELGTLSINAAVSDSQVKDQSLVFLPGDLPDGIEAQDPMLKARTKAYAESFERRQP